jgi:outer membrane protein assembly factor BamB
MYKYFKYFLLAFCIIMAGCSKDKKEPLVGERETIFIEEDELQADADAAKRTVNLPKATTNTEWAMASGSAHHAMPPLSVGNKLQQVWSRGIGKGSTSTARLLNGPIAADGKVFTVDINGLVTAIDIKTGAVVWEAQSIPEQKSAQPFSGGLAYENGNVFCATPAAEVVMFDAKSGQLLKSFSLTAPVRAAPTVKNGLIFAVTINNQLEVINYHSGDPVWSHNGILETAGLLGGSSPASDGEVVIVPYTSGEVYALRADNGTPLWSESLANFQRLDPVSSLYHIKARPVIASNMVYLISHGGQMKAVDLHTGETAWMKSIGGIRSPAISGEYLFMITTQNELICMDRISGKVIWVSKLPMYRDPTARDRKILWAGPVLANDRLIVAGSNDTALVLSTKDGSLLQTLSLPGEGHLSPIIVDGTVLFLTNNAELVAYR